MSKGLQWGSDTRRACARPCREHTPGQQPAGGQQSLCDFGSNTTFLGTSYSPTQGGSSECREASGCAGRGPQSTWARKVGQDPGVLFLSRTLPFA